MRTHHSDPRIEKKHFWRDHNDDDNPTYPELRRPPRMGNADIDQTESDVPNLSKKEAEDFDRIVVQAKKEKEEKLKKEKEEKEKKEKDGKKDDAKKSFSQRKHKNKHHHKHDYHQQSIHNQGYVQLSQDMNVK